MTLTIAVLSWGSHKTLINTLNSYEEYGLYNLADERIIWFQEFTKPDLEIARRYGYHAYGSPTNIGISGGYKGLVQLATSDLFLFLENDWLLTEDPTQQIKDAKALIGSGYADVARLRSRNNPGHPLWTKQFEGNELSRPEHLLDSIHWTNPSRFYQIKPVLGTWFETIAPFANWTNNPTMFRREWLIENILPRLDGDIERSIQSWWEEQSFKVVQGEGLFTHWRLD